MRPSEIHFRRPTLPGFCTFALLVALPIAACNSGQSLLEVATLTGDTMGTRYRVVVVDELAHRSAGELSNEIEKCLAEVDRAMSTWRSDSEVSAFNRTSTTGWFPVSPATAKVVLAALEISRVTKGAFDITVAPVIELWQFGSNRSEPGVPDPELVAAALALVGWRHLEAREEPPALRKAIPRLTIDLSAIAKGYAVDAIAEALSNAGIENYLVEIGGEIRVAGQRANGRPWRVGVETPTSDPTIREVLEFTDRALATSGDYRNFFVLNGKRYSHVIDPRTGMPVDEAPASVSVVAATCMEADALATSLMVMEREAGLTLAAERTAPVQFLFRVGNGLRRDATESFENLVVEHIRGD
jgi:thiamine biosynthesis lipoprotein